MSLFTALPQNLLACFFDEFPCLLEKLITASACLVLIDDFNFHVDDKSDPAALKFPQLLLEVFNLR